MSNNPLQFFAGVEANKRAFGFGAGEDTISCMPLLMLNSASVLLARPRGHMSWVVGNLSLDDERKRLLGVITFWDHIAPFPSFHTAEGHSIF